MAINIPVLLRFLRGVFRAKKSNKTLFEVYLGEYVIEYRRVVKKRNNHVFKTFEFMEGYDGNNNNDEKGPYQHVHFIHMLSYECTTIWAHKDLKK